MKKSLPLSIFGIIGLILIIVIVTLKSNNSEGFDDYQSNNYDSSVINNADIVLSDVKSDVTEYTSDDKVNSMISQVESEYKYQFKEIEAEFTDALTNIYVRSCIFTKSDGTECTVFINTLSDGTVIAQVE